MTDGTPEHATSAADYRTLSDFLQGTVDAASLALLAESNVEGVPIPYCVESAKVSSEWTRRLDEEGGTPELMADIHAGVAEREAQYPDTPMWDRMRALHAGQLFGAGYVEDSLDLVAGMRSRHAMAAVVLGLAATEEGAHYDLIVASFIQRFTGEENRERLLGLTRALADHAIEDDPFKPVIDTYEGILAAAIPNYDPLQGWADSQRELTPDADWDEAVAYIRDEGLWQGVPMRYRQYAIRRYHGMLDIVGEEVDAELITAIIETIDEAQNQFPDARVWDEFRGSLTVSLLDSGQPTFALACARTLRDWRYQQGAVSSFIDSGAEAEALELASAMADPRDMAVTLLDADWSDDRGLMRLTEIIQDENYPVERRIACLEFIRDRLLLQGNAEAAEKYAAQIAELQRRPKQ